MTYSFMSVNVGKAEIDGGREREERENLFLLRLPISFSLFCILLSHCMAIDIVIENR